MAEKTSIISNSNLRLEKDKNLTLNLAYKHTAYFA